MAVDDYNDNNNNSLHHMRRDIREADRDSSVAKLLSYLALLASAIALAVAIGAWNKANDALGNAQRAVNATSQSQTQ